MKNKLFKVWADRIEDEYPDLSYLDQFEDSNDSEERKYYKRDQERKSEYGAYWYMLGIVAYAEIGIPILKPNGEVSHYTIQKVSSGGLWGIESDSGEDYFESIEREELDSLREILKSMNVNIREFKKIAVFSNNKSFAI